MQNEEKKLKEECVENDAPKTEEKSKGKYKKDKSAFITARESRRISRENSRITREYEKRKKRKNVPESEYLSQMKDDKNIVEYENLHTYFFTDAGVVKAVNGVTFSVPQGSTVGIVGESGCGKSVTAFSLMQLVAAPAGQVIEGSEIRFKSTVYVEEDGKKVPLYEFKTDLEGNVIKTEVPKLDEDGNEVKDKDGNVVMELVPEILKRPKLSKPGKELRDKDGNLIMEKVQRLDEEGNPLTGQDGQPLYEYETNKDGTVVKIDVPKLDKDGNEVKDKDGNVVMESVLKILERPKLSKEGNEVRDKSGRLIMEKVQRLNDEGIPQFLTEEKVYNVAQMPTEVMRKIRGREISMIFQEPMTSLNPIFTIGNQMDEVVLLHTPGATKESAKRRTFEMLKLVGIIPENVYNQYPHELSGGMRQRVIIAMSLSCNPKLIIADEPTTALDVTIQAQILELLRDIKDKISGSIMLITHDLGVIAEMADYVVVMYAGRIIEQGTAKEIFDNPMHPYTIGLQKSKPSVNKKVDRLYSIPGTVPNPINMPTYCYFKGRCDRRQPICDGDYPCMIQVSETHKVACHLYSEKFLKEKN